MKLVTTVIFFGLILALCQTLSAQRKPRIAVFSGGTATVQNSVPLVTSNKARSQQGLPLLTDPDGRPVRFDHLAPQRLAAPVEVLIEQFSGHPLEVDAAALYGPPDGYLDANGNFKTTRSSPQDKPVQRVTLLPEDGLYLLPYMSMQADGSPWEGLCSQPGAPPERCRQSFFPDASRLFEEIDRGLVGRDSRKGTANSLASRARFDFYRAVPAGGYTKGLAQRQRTDMGDGPIPPELLGEDYFPYTPYRRDPRMEDLARLTNVVQDALTGSDYAGAIWLEGSYNVSETTYWLNLLIDTEIPISGNAAQRAHGSLSNDGGQNIVDSVTYILSRAWADPKGKDEVGAVLLQDEQIIASRQVDKKDARPGGYTPVGDYGGVLGAVGPPVTLWFKPTTRHTWKSEVNLTRLPPSVPGVRKRDGRIETIQVKVKDGEGRLLGDAIPKVSMVQYNRYYKDNALANPGEEVETLARLEKNLRDRPLSGFVAEGVAGEMHEPLEEALQIASMSGIPVVRVSRGKETTPVKANPSNLTVEGSNLSSIKARLLLMAALMRFGALPPAKDPAQPSQGEKEAVREKIALFQEVFNTH